MKKRLLLNLDGKESKIYEEIVKALEPHKHKKALSTEFIVEGTINNPIISIRYPGKKLVRLTPKRKNAIEWGNLFDFLVVIYDKRGEEHTTNFTFENILHDFEKYKKHNDEFWSIITEVYQKNKITREPPKLRGINPQLFILALKWIWIQEDFNYKLRHDEVKSATKYKLISKRGSNMSRGAGRAKFYGALVLLKNGFTIEEVKKVIPMYA